MNFSCLPRHLGSKAEFCQDNRQKLYQMKMYWVSLGKCHQIGRRNIKRDLGIQKGESRWFLPSGPLQTCSFSMATRCSRPALQVLHPVGPDPAQDLFLPAGEESRTEAKTWRQFCFQQPNSFRVTVPIKRNQFLEKKSGISVMKYYTQAPSPLPQKDK